MKKIKRGHALLGVAIRSLLRRGASALLAALVLIGCFSSIALHRLTQRQEETLARMVSDTRISCVVTDPQGMNVENLGLSGEMLLRLTGDHWQPEMNLDEYVMNVNAMSSIDLDFPTEHSICGIYSLESDPALSPVEGAVVEFYEGWDESVFHTEQRVCLIPAQEMELYPEGKVNVIRSGGYALEMTVIGTVQGGLGSVYYAPMNMTWDADVSFSKQIKNCSFYIRDNRELEETKAALYEEFVVPKLSNDLGGNQFGLIVHDEAYLATLEEIESNLDMLRILLPVLMVLIGAIGCFASYMTTRSRQKEFAVMRCLGMKQGKIFSLVIFEQTLLALLGGALGVGFGWVIDGSLEAGALVKAGAVIAVFLAGASVAAIRVTGVNVMKLMKVED